MSSPVVAICGVDPLETNQKLNEPFKLKTVFECYEDLESEVEWEMSLAWDGEKEHDQVLGTVEVGPLPAGKHQFEFESSPPDYTKVQEDYITDVAVLFLHGSYQGKVFVTVAFYVSHIYPELKEGEEMPEKPQLDKLARVISTSDVRTTTFPM